MDESGEDKKYCGARSKEKIRERSVRLTKNERFGDTQKILYRASVSFEWTRNDGAGMRQIDERGWGNKQLVLPWAL